MYYVFSRSDIEKKCCYSLKFFSRFSVKNIYEKTGRERIQANAETCLLLEERVP
jgi:hypothetical protein